MLDLTDPEAVRWAVAEFDELGEDAFFRKYRFGDARRLFLVVDGREYPSKAIFGAAIRRQHGRRITAADFSGGLITVVGPLRAMGFEVVDKGAEPRNPPWLRDELILALDLYMQVAGRFPGERSPEVVALSEQLNALQRALGTPQSATLRNPNGVAMKLMNFRRLDPTWQNAGRQGLTRGNRLELEVWNEFHSDQQRLRAVAAAIMRGIGAALDGGLGATADAVLEEYEEAPEGRVLTVVHFKRERSKKITRDKKESVLRAKGRLACEACDFTFLDRYGERGRGFIECHHIQPVESFQEGHRTRLEDLALLCANCHRMIHAERPWLSISELKGLLAQRP